MLSVPGSKAYAKTTINNLDGTKNFLWAHIILASVLLVLGIYMMHRFSRAIKADNEKIARRTLLIRRIPKEKRNKDTLVSFFTDIFSDLVIEGVQFVYDVYDLEGLSNELTTVQNAKLYCDEFNNEFKTRYKIRPAFLGQFGFLCPCCRCCDKVDGVKKYSEREKEIEKEIEIQFQQTISKPMGSVFLTFETEKMAQE